LSEEKPTALTSRADPDGLVEEVGRAHHLGGGAYRPVAGASIQPLNSSDEGEVLSSGQPPMQSSVSGRYEGRAPRTSRQVADEHVSGISVQEAGKDPKKRALSASVVT
jgi:hypothetical protein